MTFEKSILLNNSKSFISWRIVCFIACIPSGGALLLKVYGILEMHQAVYSLVLPGFIILLISWYLAKRHNHKVIAQALSIGFIGGLLGTLAYDLVRIPFLFEGRRVFAPIFAYGVWVLDAPISSRFTDVTGWTYHFSNGITFGIMYALFMRKRHWAWAIVWAFLLETIAIVSPFADIFKLTGDYYKIGIAYLGHIAYGLPLGIMVKNWDKNRALINHYYPKLKWPAIIVAAMFLLGPLADPSQVRADKRSSKDGFRVEDRFLNPDWLRIDKGQNIRIFNEEISEATIMIIPGEKSVKIPKDGNATVDFPETGIYQLFVKTNQKSHSSFVIVEPVHKFR